MSFKESVIKNRYETFHSLRETSPFFDEELNAHIVLKYSDIGCILNSPNALANRKRKHFEEIEALNFSEVLIKFYGEWLMYMDGKKHQELRKKINKSLASSYSKVDDIVYNSWENIKLKFNQKHINIIEEISKPLVTNTLSTLLGISDSDYLKILNSSSPIISFLGNGDFKEEKIREEVTNSIKGTGLIIQRIIENKSYEENSVIDTLLKDSTPIEEALPLLINVIVDGYEPLLNSINCLVYLVVKEYKKNIDLLEWENSPIIEEVLRLEPPFQYIARVMSEDLVINNYKIQKGDRVMNFIAAANRDPEIFENPDMFNLRDNKNHISFGKGSHHCSGASLARKVMALFLEKLKVILKENSIEISNFKWNKNLGYRYLEELEIIKNEVKND